MIERRGLFFRGDLLLDIFDFPFFPAIRVQFARVFQSATGIIDLSQVVIATSTDAEKMIDDVEDLLCATGQGQIETRFSVFAQSSDLHLGNGILPQAHSGLANVAYFAAGRFWRTEAFFISPLQLMFATAWICSPEIKDNEGSLGVAE
jgi:hypothetical protein